MQHTETPPDERTTKMKIARNCLRIEKKSIQTLKMGLRSNENGAKHKIGVFLNFFSLQLHVFTKRVEDEEMCALFTSVSSYFPSSEVHFCLHIQYGWFASIMPHTALPFAMALEIAQWTRWLAGCFLILLCRFLFFLLCAIAVEIISIHNYCICKENINCQSFGVCVRVMNCHFLISISNFLFRALPLCSLFLDILFFISSFAYTLKGFHRSFLWQRRSGDGGMGT